MSELSPRLTWSRKKSRFDEKKLTDITRIRLSHVFRVRVHHIWNLDFTHLAQSLHHRVGCPHIGPPNSDACWLLYLDPCLSAGRISFCKLPWCRTSPIGAQRCVQSVTYLVERAPRILSVEPTGRRDWPCPLPSFLLRKKKESNESWGSDLRPSVPRSGPAPVKRPAAGAP